MGRKNKIATKLAPVSTTAGRAAPLAAPPALTAPKLLNSRQRRDAPVGLESPGSFHRAESTKETVKHIYMGPGLALHGGILSSHSGRICIFDVKVAQREFQTGPIIS